MTNSEARKREAARNAAPNTTGLRERAERFLVQCGACDAGLPMGCACHVADPRPVIAALLDALAAHPDTTPDACYCGPNGGPHIHTMLDHNTVGCGCPPEPDATVSDPAPLTDADPWSRIVQINANSSHYREASREIVALAPAHLDGRDVNVVLSRLHRSVVDDYMVLAPWMEARVAEAVEQERAARLALVAKIEALADPAEMERAMYQHSGMNEDLLPLAAVPASNVLRSLLTADDTEAAS